jgi:hypothetical protein
MTMEDSFCIKDVNIYNQTNKFWVYTVNNINYYVPNAGYLFMIDHNYRDNTKASERKILSEQLFGDKEKDIYEKIYENLEKCINVSNFINDMVIPDKSKSIIDKIHNDIGNSTFKTAFTTASTTSGNALKIYEETIIHKYLGKFMNNRISKPLRDLEKIYINKDDISPFRPGELVIYEESYDKYVIMLYLEIVTTNFYKCITKKGDDVEIRNDIDKTRLYHYSNSEEIKQDIVIGDSGFTIDNLIETYII